MSAGRTQLLRRDDRGYGSTIRAALRGELPPRYSSDVWDLPFRDQLERLLAPDQRVLDLGAGARPVLPPDVRPANCTYVGLDISRAELEKAPAGSYDEIVVGDARERIDSLAGRFDLIVSWLALEHVKPLPPAIANARLYLRPGGTLLAQVPGRFSPFSLLNLMLPSALTQRVLRRTQDRDPETVFPAHYHRCWHAALTALFGEGWSECKVRPLYTGAGYLAFSRLLTSAYIAYEELLYRRSIRNLAAFYLIQATRDRSG